MMRCIRVIALGTLLAACNPKGASTPAGIPLQRSNSPQSSTRSLETQETRANNHDEASHPADCSSSSEWRVGEFALTVKSFTLLERMPSEGSGGEAFFDNGHLFALDYGYYASLGKVQVRARFHVESTYDFEVVEYAYRAPLDPANAKIRFHRAQVCSGRLMNETPSDLIKRIRRTIEHVVESIQNGESAYVLWES